VPAERQPLVELAVVDEQDFFVVNDENRDGEINFSWMCAISKENFNNKETKARRKNELNFASLRLCCSNKSPDLRRGF